MSAPLPYPCADPHIGLLHRGTEKLLEYKTYLQVCVMCVCVWGGGVVYTNPKWGVISPCRPKRNGGGGCGCGGGGGEGRGARDGGERAEEEG